MTLREALELDGTLSSHHREKIAQLAQLCPHSIVHLEEINESTCVTYALGFNGNAVYREIALTGPFAGRQFMEWLIRQHLTEFTSAKPGCLACYFSNGVWKHVGIVGANNRVVSQWGTFPVYEHELFEVPQSYGEQVRWFAKPENSVALQWFVQFIGGT